MRRCAWFLLGKRDRGAQTRAGLKQPTDRAQELASGGGVGTSRSGSGGGDARRSSMAGGAATVCGANVTTGKAGSRETETTAQAVSVDPQVLRTGFPDSTSLACVQTRHWHFVSALWWAQQQEAGPGAVSSGSCTASIAITQTPRTARARHQGIVNVRRSRPRPRIYCGFTSLSVCRSRTPPVNACPRDADRRAIPLASPLGRPSRRNAG